METLSYGALKINMLSMSSHLRTTHVMYLNPNLQLRNATDLGLLYDE